MRLVLVLILLAGCARPVQTSVQATQPQPQSSGGWVKVGATEDQFIADRGYCVAQAFAAYSIFQQNMILMGCMQSRGYRWVVQ